MEGLSSNKRVRDHSDELAESTEFTLPEVKRLRQDLFDGLDDSDLCTSSQDLDSFMKSFEDEIAGLSPAAVEVVGLESDSGESRPELGYLLEASDDELGLPPSISAETESGLVRVDSDSSELWRFEDQIRGYDSFDFGLGNTVGPYDSNSEFVALDGLFDYSDIGFGSSDLSWQHESLHAL